MKDDDAKKDLEDGPKDIQGNDVENHSLGIPQNDLEEDDHLEENPEEDYEDDAGDDRRQDPDYVPEEDEYPIHALKVDKDDGQEEENIADEDEDQETLNGYLSEDCAATNLRASLRNTTRPQSSRPKLTLTQSLWPTAQLRII